MKTTEGTCAECGGLKRLSTCHHPTDPPKGKVCGSCYQRLTDPVAACAECRKVTRLSACHPADPLKGKVCGGCYRRLKAVARS